MFFLLCPYPTSNLWLDVVDCDLMLFLYVFAIFNFWTFNSFNPQLLIVRFDTHIFQRCRCCEVQVAETLQLRTSEKVSGGQYYVYHLKSRENKQIPTVPGRVSQFWIGGVAADGP